MQLDTNSSLYIALVQDSRTSVQDIIGMSTAEIDNLVVWKEDPASNPVTSTPVKGGPCAHLHALQSLFAFRNEQGSPIEDSDWINLTQDKFDQCQVSPELSSAAV